MDEADILSRHRGFDGLNDGLHSTEVCQRAAMDLFPECRPSPCCSTGRTARPFRPFRRAARFSEAVVRGRCGKWRSPGGELPFARPFKRSSCASRGDDLLVRAKGRKSGILRYAEGSQKRAQREEQMRHPVLVGLSLLALAARKCHGGEIIKQEAVSNRGQSSLIVLS